MWVYQNFSKLMENMVTGKMGYLALFSNRMEDIRGCLNVKKLKM